MAEETNPEAEKGELTVGAGLPNSVFAKSTDQIRRRSDQYRQINANNMTMSINTWDVAITFGEVAGEQEGKTVIEETVKITLTREIAKVLAALLNNHLAIFEDRFWEIKVPTQEATTAELAAEIEAPEEKPQ